MSTVALEGLLNYLYGTLSPSNMRWVGEHLIEYAKKEQDERLRPYTMAELNARIDQAEANVAAGKTITHEESMRRWKEKIARKKLDLEMADAV